jgi:hypothetical protein
MARNPIVPEFLRTRNVNRFWFCSNDPCSCTCYPCFGTFGILYLRVCNT